MYHLHRANDTTEEHIKLLKDLKKEREQNLLLKDELESLKRISPIEAYSDFDEAWLSIKKVLSKEINLKRTYAQIYSRWFDFGRYQLQTKSISYDSRVEKNL